MCNTNAALISIRTMLLPGKPDLLATKKGVTLAE